MTEQDILVSNIVSAVIIEIVNPELIKEFLFKANEGYYVKSRLAFGHVLRVIKEDNILLLEGEKWKQRRKIFSQVFNYDLISSKVPEIIKLARDQFQTMEEKYANKL